MFLLELFEGPKDNNGDDDNSVVRNLRDQILDILMPLAAQGVPFITVQAVVDKMKELQSGIQVDRALVMHVLDPVEAKMVSKIEGDRIYFTLSNPKDDEDQSEEQAQQDKVGDMAMKQAKDSIKSQNGVAPAPSPEVAANPKTGPF